MKINCSELFRDIAGYFQGIYVLQGTSETPLAFTKLTKRFNMRHHSEDLKSMLKPLKLLEN